MKTLKLLLPLLLIATGCQHRTPAPVPEAAPVVIQRTDTRPVADSAKRAADRGVAGAAGTLVEVRKLQDENRKTLQAALDAKDTETVRREVAMAEKLALVQVAAEVSSSQVRALSEEVAGLSAALSTTAEARDRALFVVQQKEVELAAWKAKHAEDTAYLSGRRDAALEELRVWRLRALVTWGILGMLTTLCVGIKIWKPL